MRRGPFGFPVGRDLSPSLFGFPLGEDADILRFPPITDMVGWYDFSDFSSMTIASDLISQINDKSGNGNHAVQATGTRQPGYGAARTRLLNGIVVADFDSGDWLDTSLSGTDTTFSWFCVGEWDGETDSCMLGVTGSNKFLAAANTLELHFFNGSFNLMPFPLFASGKPFAAGVTFDTPAIRMLFGSFVHTLSAAGSAPTGNYRIGNREEGPGQEWNGSLAEVLIYDRPLSDGDAALTMNYLRERWAISG